LRFESRLQAAIDDRRSERRLQAELMGARRLERRLERRLQAAIGGGRSERRLQLEAALS